MLRQSVAVACGGFALGPGVGSGPPFRAHWNRQCDPAHKRSLDRRSLRACRAVAFFVGESGDGNGPARIRHPRLRATLCDSVLPAGATSQLPQPVGSAIPLLVGVLPTVRRLRWATWAPARGVRLRAQQGNAPPATARGAMHDHPGRTELALAVAGKILGVGVVAVGAARCGSTETRCQAPTARVLTATGSFAASIIMRPIAETG